MHATDSNDRVHAVAATRVPLLQPHTNSGGGGGGGGGGGVGESGEWSARVDTDNFW